MRMLMVGLHATGRGSTDGARVADLTTTLLPLRFPEVVGHATAMTVRPRLVEVAIVLHEGVPDPRAALRRCVEELVADLAAQRQVVAWACHSPRLPGDPEPAW
jgi:hypothetical protein